MAQLYKQHVLKEQPRPELVQLSAIAPAPAAVPAKPVEEREEVGSFGD